MKREQLSELHYITPKRNVQSIISHGILSHELAAGIDHESCAMDEIQKLRAKVVVPGGRPLHDYVNLYFHARNPMMFKRSNEHQNLAVIIINPDVLDLPGVVVTDRNAAVGYVRFGNGPDGLAIVDYDLVFARDWRHSDIIEYWNRKSAKCAEVLIPEKVEPQFIKGIYVSRSENCEKMVSSITRIRSDIVVIENGDLFFL